MLRLLLLLVCAATRPGSSTINITIGSLSGYNAPNIFNIVCIQAAIDDAQKAGWTTDININVLTAYAGCDPKLTTMAAVGYVLVNNVSLLLGPGLPACSPVCGPLSFLASFANVPLFSNACIDAAYDSTYYSNLVRFSGSTSVTGRSLVKVFTQYNWKQVAFISQTIGDCGQSVSALATSCAANNISINLWIKEDSEVSMDVLTSYMQRLRDLARIIVICLSNRSLFYSLVVANRLGMANGDFAFFTLSRFPPAPISLIFGVTNDTVVRNDFFEAAQYLKMVTLAVPNSPRTTAFIQRIQTDYNVTLIPGSLSLYLYDTLSTYLLIINRTLASGGSIYDTGKILQQTTNKIYNGLTGTIYLDSTSSRLQDCWLYQFNPYNSTWVLVGDLPYINGVLNYTPQPNIFWGDDALGPPTDIPPCGFDGGLCPAKNPFDTSSIVAVCVVVGACVIATVAAVIWRFQKMERDLYSMTWKVKYEDVQISTDKAHGSVATLSKRSVGSNMSGETSTKSLQRPGRQQAFAVIGDLKGEIVAVKHVKKTSVTLTRKDLVELQAMKEMNHENINSFVGACIEPNKICYMMTYCSKGSLQDIIENDDIKLDKTFIFSIIADIINGMCYLHQTVLGSHGHLKSSNCLIDNRWVLKISSYGLRCLRHEPGYQPTPAEEYKYYRGLLWTAPELLRQRPPPPYGTQRGDIYSFAIILQELIFHTSPFFATELTPKEIVQRVRDFRIPPYRPQLPVDHGQDKRVLDVMEQCWHENELVRPSFADIKKRLAFIFKEGHTNFFDNMLHKLEKYAADLESIVGQRTGELVSEKLKSDTLLYSMLPKTIAEQLKTGVHAAPEIYEAVSVLFSAISDFTELATVSSPLDIVNVLNDLYGIIDDAIQRFDVYKVETIKDVYMVASGLPRRNGLAHVTEIADLALSLLQIAHSFTIRHLPGRKLLLCIGVHSGSCAAGVIGLTMPRYCLFGDTVNTASRMESTGKPLKIHLSWTSHEALSAFQQYTMERRGEIDIKGKGRQTTYWLTGKLEQVTG